MKVKIFEAQKQASDLEAQFNEWASQNPHVNVKDIKFAGSVAALALPQSTVPLPSGLIPGGGPSQGHGISIQVTAFNLMVLAVFYEEPA